MIEPAAHPGAKIPVVLIIDDDRNTTTLARATIERVGMRGEEAHDGETRLEAFERGQHDMVLLDVMMPGIDGFEVCLRLRKVARNGTTPI